MSDSQKSPGLEQIPEAIYERRRRRTSQLVWLVPVVATIIGLSLAITSFLNRGPIITITFKSGEGIEAGKTRIKYKDVQIGEVRAVTIAKDRSHVIVTAELTKNAEDLLVEDTSFWVVRLALSGGGISGLSTLMAGSYIGMDVGKSKEQKLNFTGLERPPVITRDEPGRQFMLHAADIGSLNLNSPVFFRHLQVGEVIAYELDKDGKGVTMKIFVRAPYDQYVKSNTLFWHASGIDFSFDASGLKVNTESMAAILLGGIAFQAPEDSSGIKPASPNSTFTLFANRDEAFKRPDTVMENYTLIFRESVRGLSVGAPVDLRGVTVGEVTRINLDLDTRAKKFVMPVEITFYPERLRAHSRIKSASGNMDSRQLLGKLVESGLRAQLRSSNLLTGQLYIALDFFPRSAAAKMDWSKNPPEFPTQSGSMEQFQTSLMQIVQKLERLPLEEIAGDARQSLQSLDATLKSADKLLKSLDGTLVPETRHMLEDVRSTLGQANKALDSARQTMSADAPLQQDLRDTLRELGRAAQSLRTLGDYLERHPESLIRGKKEDER